MSCFASVEACAVFPWHFRHGLSELRSGLSCKPVRCTRMRLRLLSAGFFVFGKA